MISESYKNQLQILHSKKKFSSGIIKYPLIKEFVETYKPKSLLDYGCSSGSLIDQLRTDFPTINPLDGFDPGVVKFEKINQTSYDCMISNDVIEHFEPEFLKSTLGHMQELFDRYAYFIIACYPAKKTLPDGRNAHLIVESPDWWISTIARQFSNSEIIQNEIIELKPGYQEVRLILQKRYHYERN